MGLLVCRLQDAAADGAGHGQQLFLPDEAELHLVLVGIADRQLRSLQRVAKACRLDAEMDDLAVGQHKNFLPGARDTLHIHDEDAVGGKHSLIAHRLVRAHDLLAVQQQLLHIFADIFFLDADEVPHRFFPKFHGLILLSVCRPSITPAGPRRKLSLLGDGCVIMKQNLFYEGNFMEIIIHQAILHVLDTTLDAPVLSGSCMEPTAEKTAYLQYHIEKLLASDDIRQCRPLPDSAFKNELEHNKDFVDLSCRIAGVLFDYMHAHTTIPGADLAVVDFTRDGAPWLGILKLNYKNGYTHYTEDVNGAPVNSLIQQRACLPTQSGKVEEGALVDLTDYSMRLLEKKYDIDGHKEFYLSTVVFQYTQAEPEKKKLQAIQEAAAQAVKDSYADEPHADAQVAMVIANQAADNDNQVSVELVRRQLAEDYPLAAVPFDDYVEKSEVLEPAAHDQPVTVSSARIRRMESRSIHTANGIEVKIPTEMLSEDSAVEFLHDEDGSISLLIKNVIL